MGIQALGMVLLIWSFMGGGYLVALLSIFFCSVAIGIYLGYIRRMNATRRVNDLRFNQWLDHVQELKRREAE